jgi:predicted RNA-binding protein YlxR (DUF448 family)
MNYTPKRSGLNLPTFTAKVIVNLKKLFSNSWALHPKKKHCRGTYLKHLINTNKEIKLKAIILSALKSSTKRRVMASNKESFFVLG